MRCLAQGHLDTQLGGAGLGTTGSRSQAERTHQEQFLQPISRAALQGAASGTWKSLGMGP